MKTVILWILIVLAVILLIAKNISYSEMEDRLDRSAMAVIDELDKKFSFQTMQQKTDDLKQNSDTQTNSELKTLKTD